MKICNWSLAELLGPQIITYSLWQPLSKVAHRDPFTQRTDLLHAKPHSSTRRVEVFLRAEKRARGSVEHTPTAPPQDLCLCLGRYLCSADPSGAGRGWAPWFLLLSIRHSSLLCSGTVSTEPSPTCQRIFPFIPLLSGYPFKEITDQPSPLVL